jgi:hypothetical protein
MTSQGEHRQDVKKDERDLRAPDGSFLQGWLVAVSRQRTGSVGRHLRYGGGEGPGRKMAIGRTMQKTENVVRELKMWSQIKAAADVYFVILD